MEDVYRAGKQLNRYPFDQVVSFVYRNRPQKPRGKTSILEVGCGAGNNLWFAAREGFLVAGIDSSKTAIEYARGRFEAEGLQGDLRIGDFSELPWGDGGFDLVLDRGALATCPEKMGTAIGEIYRVLCGGGKFYFNPYREEHIGHVLGRKWRLSEIVRVDYTDGRGTVSEWRITCEKL